MAYIRPFRVAALVTRLPRLPYEIGEGLVTEPFGGWSGFVGPAHFFSCDRGAVERRRERALLLREAPDPQRLVALRARHRREVVLHGSVLDGGLDDALDDRVRARIGEVPVRPAARRAAPAVRELVGVEHVDERVLVGGHGPVGVVRVHVHDADRLGEEVLRDPERRVVGGVARLVGRVGARGRRAGRRAERGAGALVDHGVPPVEVEAVARVGRSSTPRAPPSSGARCAASASPSAFFQFGLRATAMIQKRSRKSS